MKVKIGDQIFDSNDEPIMLIMDDIDRNNISKSVKVHADYTLRYVSFPEGGDINDIREWMYDDINKNI